MHTRQITHKDITIRVHHNADWSGEATLSWPADDRGLGYGEVQIPGYIAKVLVELMDPPEDDGDRVMANIADPVVAVQYSNETLVQFLVEKFPADAECYNMHVSGGVLKLTMELLDRLYRLEH